MRHLGWEEEIVKQSNRIVVYKSSTGFTKKYAEMIAERMECALADYRSVSADMLSGYDVVIFGTRAHAGMMDGYQKAKKLFEKSGVSRLILFVTGATPNAAAETVERFGSRTSHWMNWQRYRIFIVNDVNSFCLTLGKRA